MVQALAQAWSGKQISILFSKSFSFNEWGVADLGPVMIADLIGG